MTRPVKRALHGMRPRARITRARVFSLVAMLVLYAGVCAVASRLALEIVPALLLATISLFDFTPGRAVALRLAERRYRRLAARRAVKRVLLPASTIFVAPFVERVSAYALAMRPPPAVAFELN